MVHFPVKAAVRSNANDHPRPDVPANSIGIFDSMGYWASLGNGPLELPGDNLDLGNRIAAMINAAYEYGKADAQEAIRKALGIEDAA